MHEEAPSAPAQTITSRMRKPQNSLHWVLVSRGRATCCSTAGVCEAAGSGGAQRREQGGNGEREGMGWGGHEEEEEDRTVGLMVERGTGLGQCWALVMEMKNGTGMNTGIRQGDGDSGSDLDADPDGRSARALWFT